MSALVRSDAQCCYRRRVINVARQVQLFLGWIVMVAQKIVCLHDVDITNLRCLEDLACAFSSGDIPARTHLAPPAKRAAHPNLRPNSNDQRDAEVEQPVGTQTTAGWAADIEQKDRSQNKAQ